MGAGPLEAGNYLKSMSPREELSSFLTTRADCLRENGRWVEAYDTYYEAAELAPENLFVAGLLRMTAKTLQRMHAAQQVEAAYQRHERRRRTDPRLMIPGLPSIPPAHAFTQPGGQGVPRTLRQINLDGTGWKLPTMQDYLNETNRRNRELMRYGLPGINPATFGAAHTAPLSQAPFYGQRP